MILAVDPGLRACGCALFSNDGLLVVADWIDGAPAGRGPKAWYVTARSVGLWIQGGLVGAATPSLVIEVPRIYPKGDQQKGDPNDLLELAGVVGALAATFDLAQSYYPAEWKGQVPKKIMGARIRSKLTAAELACIMSSDHNTLDAVGVGLKYCGRL